MTSQHMAVDGVPNDAVDWSESEIILQRCQCGAFLSPGSPCKRCETLKRFFTDDAGLDECTAQQLTDAVAAAPDPAAAQRTVATVLKAHQNGHGDMLPAATAALAHYHQNGAAPEAAGSPSPTPAGDDPLALYQSERARFVALMGEDALDENDDLAPGYEGLQDTPLYARLAQARQQYRATAGLADNPEVAEGEMRDGAYTVPKRLRASLQATGLTRPHTNELARRFARIGQESAGRQQRRIQATVERILTEEGVTDPQAIARVVDVMNGRARPAAPASSKQRGRSGAGATRATREVSEATRQKLREAARQRRRCGRCGAFMGQTACKRCAALRDALAAAGIASGRLEGVLDRVAGATRQIEKESRQRNHALMRQEAQDYLAEIGRGELALPVFAVLERQLGEAPEPLAAAHETVADEWIRLGARPFDNPALFPDMSRFGIQLAETPYWGNAEAEQAARWQHKLETMVAVARGFDLAPAVQAAYPDLAALNVALSESRRADLDRTIASINAGEEWATFVCGRYPALVGAALETLARAIREGGVSDANRNQVEVAMARLRDAYYVLSQASPPEAVAAEIAAAETAVAETAPAEPAETAAATDGATEPGQIVKCPRCGKFASPERGCEHCHLPAEEVADPAQHELGWYVDGRNQPVYTTRAGAAASAFAGPFASQEEVEQVTGVAVAGPLPATGAAPEPAAPTPVARTRHVVSHEGDWTWIKFPDADGLNQAEREAQYRPILDALRGQHGARWSRRRKAWWICSPVSEDEIARLVAEAEPPPVAPLAEAAALPAAPKTLAQPEPVAAGTAARPGDWVTGEAQRDFVVEQVTATETQPEPAVVLSAPPANGRYQAPAGAIREQFGVDVAPVAAVSANGVSVQPGDVFRTGDGRAYQVREVEQGSEGAGVRAVDLSSPIGIGRVWMPGQFEKEVIEPEARPREIWQCGQCKSFVSPQDPTCKRCAAFAAAMAEVMAGAPGLLTPDDVGIIRDELISRAIADREAGDFDRVGLAAALQDVLNERLVPPEKQAEIIRHALLYTETEAGYELRTRLHALGLPEQAINNLMSLPPAQRDGLRQGLRADLAPAVQAALADYFRREHPHPDEAHVAAMVSLGIPAMDAYRLVAFMDAQGLAAEQKAQIVAHMQSEAENLSAEGHLFQELRRAGLTLEEAVVVLDVATGDGLLSDITAVPRAKVAAVAGLVDHYREARQGPAEADAGEVAAASEASDSRGVADPGAVTNASEVAEAPAADEAIGRARCGRCWSFVSPTDPTCKRCERMRQDVVTLLQASGFSEADADRLLAFIQTLASDLDFKLGDRPELQAQWQQTQADVGVWQEVALQRQLNSIFVTYLRDSQKDKEDEINTRRQPNLTQPADGPDAADGDGTLAGHAAGDGPGTGSGGAAGDGGADGNSPDGGGRAEPGGSDGLHAAGSVDERARALRDPAVGRRRAGAGQPAAELADAGDGSGVDYRISDADGVGQGGLKQKYKDNVAALRLLKQLEAEARPATPAEQAVLVKYVGWGGIPQVFDSYQASPYNKNATWGKEYQELKALLTPEEYSAARGSTKNAHYTSPAVVQAMWQALTQMGYSGGNVLEPAAGIGHFFGLMPDAVHQNSNRVAVELDPVTSRILARLYPGADVRNVGYEKANLPDNYFDIVVGNVPFGDYGVVDMSYTGDKKKLTNRIHNYFFAKALDQTKPGGVVALITSRYTLDSPKHQYVREYLAAQADLVGAIRLPNTAFKENANTEVTTDIIFLRKRAEGELPRDTAWVNVVSQEVPNSYGTRTAIPVNEYFASHPEMMLGHMEATGSMYSDAQPQLVADDRPLAEALRDAVSRLPRDIAPQTLARCHCGAFMSAGGACNNPKCSTNRDVYRIAPPDLGQIQHGELVVEDGHLYRYDKSGQVLVAVEYRHNKDGSLPAGVQRAIAAVPVKQAAKRALQINVSHGSDEELAAALEELNAQYDAFVAAYGPFHAPSNLRSELKSDPELPLLLSLENYNPETKEATKADMLRRRVINLTQRPDSADSAEDALLISLFEGGINWARMHELTGVPIEELQAELARTGYVFMTPDNRWELAEAYLAGDVKQKLKDAQAAARLDPRFQRNVDALLAVQPGPLKPSDIHVGFGAGWIPPDVVEEFAAHLLGERVPIKYVPESATWYLDTSRMWKGSYANTTEWGVPGKQGHELIEDALNSRQSTITKKVSDGQGGTRRETDQAATLAAREKQEKIRKEFQDWVWSDPDRSRHLVDRYNEQFNRIVPRQYRHPYRDDPNFVFPGMNQEAFRLRDYQKDAVWRIVQGDNTLLAHMVGAGKSATMIAANMEMRRLGVRNKIVHVMPKHTLEQYYQDFRRLYPGAKVLMVGQDDVSPANRAKTLARIASEDWDAVIISQPSFERIGVSPQLEASFLETEIQKYSERIAEMESEGNSYGWRKKAKKDPTIKDLEKQKARLEKRLEEAIKASKRDDVGLSFDQLGIDQIFVDEAHAYKNLQFPTKMGRIPGINADGSNRAMDMYMKTRYLARRCKCGRFVNSSGYCSRCAHKTEMVEGGVVFATGTPLSNSVVDMYTMQRFLQEDTLSQYGLAAADAWITHFCETATTLEMKPSGDGWRPYTRVAKFRNVPEALRIFYEVADFQMDPETMGLDRPLLSGAGNRTLYGVARQAFLDFAGAGALTSKDRLAPGFEHLAETKAWLAFEKARNDYRKPIAITVPISDRQRRFFEECQFRADHLPLDPRQDNILKVLNDARKAALDYRLVEPDAPDDPDSKVNRAVETMLKVYRNHPGKTQMVFLDAGTPDGSMFDLYNDMKQKLIVAGVPAEEIGFIHDAKTDAQKLAQFQKMNEGKLRFLMGSTDKMGTGVNAQRLLVAQHHIDPPRYMRPDEVEQRDGRILRHGNTNPEVQIYRYVTEPSPDAFAWGGIERKAGFITQITHGDLTTRQMDDIGEVVLGYAEMKAAATGDPAIIELVGVEAELNKLESLERSHSDKLTGIRWRLAQMPQEIATLEATVGRLGQAEGAIRLPPDGDFTMTVGGKEFKAVLEAGQALQDIIEREKAQHRDGNFSLPGVGNLYGLPVSVQASGGKVYAMMQAGPVELPVELADNAQGNVMRLRNRLGNVAKEKARARGDLDELRDRMPKLQAAVNQPFEHEDKLRELRQRHAELKAYVAGVSAGEKKQVLDDLDSSAGDGWDAGEAMAAIDDVLAAA